MLPDAAPLPARRGEELKLASYAPASSSSALASSPDMVRSGSVEVVKTSSNAEVDRLISSYAANYEVPESLVRRVVKRESNFRPGARNGPYWGLMQILPATARGMGFDGPPSALLDAETNLKYAVKYLKGAYLVAGGDHDQAVRNYSRGYYYDAKRKGLLEAAGLKRTRMPKPAEAAPAETLRAGVVLVSAEPSAATGATSKTLPTSAAAPTLVARPPVAASIAEGWDSGMAAAATGASGSKLAASAVSPAPGVVNATLASADPAAVSRNSPSAKGGRVSRASAVAESRSSQR